MAKNSSGHSESNAEDKKGSGSEGPKSSSKERVIDKYSFKSMNIPVTVTVTQTKEDYVPVYNVDIAAISKTTQIILEKIREELIRAVNLGVVDIRDTRQRGIIEEKFSQTIQKLIERYFPDVSEQEKNFMTTYLIQRSLGLGSIEILNDDKMLEEIVINSAKDPVWVYHKTHGWLKTNITVRNEEQTKHYAVTIGRKVGRQLSVLEPLLDAHLAEGDRVNATLYPISTDGNTLTIRRTLNVLANFFPPNQRIISIEDTRELQLPSFLHWLPMSTRLPNVEGKGSITMGDLLVNSLRMRPDRILVGEVRRSREAETLFEAIHTGHSCYATFHANDAHETINRFTNAPIDVPKTLMPAISMIIIQFRNRRTGMRRTFQVAEILPDASPNVLMQYDPKKDVLVSRGKSRSLYRTLEMFTGNSPAEIK
ncbi:Flp pilus assembly complex ATPase component TadA, partial [Candidatus Woesearchaeota archaeon]|nr:Flp pilus assembly complex ATPase component TadA [Candidatus Woesearchaeota archaeon]